MSNETLAKICAVLGFFVPLLVMFLFVLKPNLLIKLVKFNLKFFGLKVESTPETQRKSRKYIFVMFLVFLIIMLWVSQPMWKELFSPTPK